jgi:hypothetical protein
MSESQRTVLLTAQVGGGAHQSSQERSRRIGVVQDVQWPSWEEDGGEKVELSDKNVEPFPFRACFVPRNGMTSYFSP